MSKIAEIAFPLKIKVIDKTDRTDQRKGRPYLDVLLDISPDDFKVLPRRNSDQVPEEVLKEA